MASKTVTGSIVLTSFALCENNRKSLVAQYFRSIFRLFCLDIEEKNHFDCITQNGQLSAKVAFFINEIFKICCGYMPGRVGSY